MSILSFSFHTCGDMLEVEAVKMVATLLISVLVLHWDSLRGAFVPAGSILNTAPKISGGGDVGSQGTQWDQGLVRKAEICPWICSAAL